MKPQDISNLMRESLRKHPLFNKNHKVDAKQINKNTIWIGYRTTGQNTLRNTAHFHLNIIDNICYILDIELNKEQRGKNLGKLLFQTIEEFAEKYGCESVRLTPSGNTYSGKTRLRYMESLGYNKIGREVEKRLK